MNKDNERISAILNVAGPEKKHSLDVPNELGMCALDPLREYSSDDSIKCYFVMSTTMTKKTTATLLPCVCDHNDCILLIMIIVTLTGLQ